MARASGRRRAPPEPCLLRPPSSRFRAGGPGRAAGGAGTLSGGPVSGRTTASREGAFQRHRLRRRRPGGEVLRIPRAKVKAGRAPLVRERGPLTWGGSRGTAYSPAILAPQTGSSGPAPGRRRRGAAFRRARGQGAASRRFRPRRGGPGSTSSCRFALAVPGRSRRLHLFFVGPKDYDLLPEASAWGLERAGSNFRGGFSWFAMPAFFYAAEIHRPLHRQLRWAIVI